MKQPSGGRGVFQANGQLRSLTRRTETVKCVAGERESSKR